MYGHIYTDEERDFMYSFVPGHSYKEIQNAFIEKFGWQITISQIKAYISNHHLNTGRNGKFKKGHAAHNKGVPMTKEVYEKAKATMFKKGNIPPNYRPVGSERITKDGYIEVKIADKNRWSLKHRVVWEKRNGPVPRGYTIIFLDGNKRNCDIKNLKMIRRRELLIMNRYNIHGENAETMEMAANLAKLIDSTTRAKKR